MSNTESTSPDKVPFVLCFWHKSIILVLSNTQQPYIKKKIKIDEYKLYTFRMKRKGTFSSRCCHLKRDSCLTSGSLPAGSGAARPSMGTSASTGKPPAVSTETSAALNTYRDNKAETVNREHPSRKPLSNASETEVFRNRRKRDAELRGGESIQLKTTERLGQWIHRGQRLWSRHDEEPFSVRRQLSHKSVKSQMCLTAQTNMFTKELPSRRTLKNLWFLPGVPHCEGTESAKSQNGPETIHFVKATHFNF